MEQVQAYTEEQLKTAGWVFEKDNQPDPTMPRYAFVTMTDGSAVLTEDDKAILASCDGLFLRGTGLGDTPGRCFSPRSLSNGQIQWYAIYTLNSLLYLIQSDTGVLSIIGASTIIDPNAVRFTVQSLTDTQKEQARSNIGAISADDIPSGGDSTLNVVHISAAEIKNGYPKDDETKALWAKADVVVGDSGMLFARTYTSNSGTYYVSMYSNQSILEIFIHTDGAFIEGGTGVDGAKLIELLSPSSVSWKSNQGLSTSNKELARRNINAASLAQVVRVDAPQTLTDAQKKQARDNIGVPDVTEIPTTAGFVETLAPLLAENAAFVDAIMNNDTLMAAIANSSVVQMMLLESSSFITQLKAKLGLS